MNKLKEKITQSKFGKFIHSLAQKEWLVFVLFLYLIGFIMFAYTLFNNEFTIPVSGDFTLQEIPFYFNGYDDWWHFFKTGEFVFWDDSAMLGVNNIGANSFYYLFNPFFLILLILPRMWLPQAQAFMMITKMVLCGVTMKMLLKYFKVSSNTSSMIGICYAFCGWNLYYLWFNHLLEVAVMMPLILYGVEKILKEQKPLPLIAAVFVSGLVNFNLLICFCFCGVIYAIFRYFQCLKEYKLIMEENKYTHEHMVDVRLSSIFLGVFAFAVGLMMAGLIMVPCFKVALGNSRVTSATYLTNIVEAFKAKDFKKFFGFLTDWKKIGYTEKNLIYPLVAFFTPNVSCMDSTVFTDYTYAYASMFVYTPIILFFFPSIIQSFKTRKVSTVIGTLGVMALVFTPFAYYCFSGFTNSPYGRWYIFLTAIACLFVGVQFDKKEEMSIWYLDLSMGLLAVIYGFLMFKGQQIDPKNVDESIYYFYAEIAFVVFLYFYIRKNFKKANLANDLRYFVAFEAIVMCNITLLVQGTSTYQYLYGGEANWKEEVRLAQTLKEEDDDYYRVFTTSSDRSSNNLAMILGTPGESTFHSIFDYDLVNFLNWSTIQYSVSKDSWSMGIHEKRVNLDEFIGTKYYILKDDDNNYPLGFTEYISTDDHVVYINDNYIQMGFAYDTILNRDIMTDYMGGSYNSNSNYVLYNEKAYLTGAILEQEDIDEIFAENSIADNFKYYTKSNKEILSDGIENAVLGSSDIIVYSKEDGKFVNKGPYSYSNVRGLKWGSYLDINTKGKGVGSECDTRGRCYVSIQARMGENLRITLYGTDKNNQEYVITSDTHMTHWFNGSKGWESKRQRGFYVNDEVTRIKIEVNDNMDSYDSSLLFPYVYYEYEDTYLAQINHLKESPLLNPKMNVNDGSFDTKFDKDKFIVLQIPFDEGWSVTRTDLDTNEKKNIKLYKGQGGFLAFYGEQGNYHYEISYATPGLTLGADAFAFGAACTVAYMFLGFYLDTSYTKMNYRYNSFQRNKLKKSKKKSKKSYHFFDIINDKSLYDNDKSFEALLDETILISDPIQEDESLYRETLM